MNKALFIFSLLLLNISALAQSFESRPERDKGILPPSANSFLLGLYGQSNVALSTGTLNETIELYNYKTPNLTVPINLHYSTNGIKVDQMESNVGMDWILEAGGVITRVVRGLPDERRIQPLRTDAHCYSQEMVNYVYSSTHQHINDTEPDLFLFNFMGKTGSFILDNDLNAMQSKQSDLKFKIVSGGKGLGNFTAVDELGIEYHFFAQEETSLEIDAIVPHQKAISAWYLTKIIHPKGDEIIFNYAESMDFYDLAQTEDTELKPRPCDFDPRTAIIYRSTYTTNYQMTAKIVILKSITSNIQNSGSIELEMKYRPPLSPIPDYLHSPSSSYISSILQKNGAGQLIEKVDLTYGYRNRVFLDQIDFTKAAKTYKLEYNGIPNKRNGAKDAWGYNSDVEALYPSPYLNYELYGMDVADEVKKHHILTGDKFTSAAILDGLLSKITYPTKGYNTFEYGKNHDIGSVLIPRKLNSVSVGLHRTNKSGESTFTNVGEEYESAIQVTLNIFGIDDGGLQVPWDQEGHTFSLYEESAPNTNNYRLIGTFSSVKVGETTSYYVNLKPDTKYKLTGNLTSSNPNLEAYAMMEYIKVPKHVEEKKIYINGVHISKIRSFDSNGTLTNYKKYGYNIKDTTLMSGKTFYDRAAYYSIRSHHELCNVHGNQAFFSTQVKTFHSKSTIPMFSELGYNKMTFSRVTISEGGDNFEQGGEEYYFNITGPSSDENCTYEGSGPHRWSLNNLDHGTLWKKNILDSNQKIIKSTEYTYKEEYDKRKTISGVAIQRNYPQTGVFGSTNGDIDPRNIHHLGITKYRVFSFKHYLQRVKTKTFATNGAVIEETENNFYDSPNHLQLSKRETVYNNKTKTDKFYYPDDVLNVNSLPGGAISNSQFDALKALKKDKSHETATVIQKESFINNNKIGTERINYFLMANKSLPHEIQWKKQETLPFEKTTTFKHYNNFGLPMEIENKGTNTVYLFGHDQSLLIAKIDNSTKEVVASALGVTVANLNTINETKLTQINNLRQNESFKEAMITTYEHKPLIGITKMIDPKGLSVSYEYNTSNQLQNIKDASGNILEEYEYNYKNN